MEELAGKNAVVVGGGQGIGRGIALALARGTFEPNAAFSHDLAFTPDGRLFGISNDLLLEFDPETLQVGLVPDT